jgi:Rps23 Pro-64 3,4-dihydroxylase Tpa1-like proline 4-hydroxylase
MIKIENSAIADCDYNIFGDWINNNELRVESKPYDHIIINNFINDDYYEKIQSSFPKEPNETWWQYKTPLEVKYTYDNLAEFSPEIKNVFYALSHETIINKLKQLFNIPNLEHDPYCHGAGLHMHPRYGRLNMHLDYEVHPITNKQRRLNIIFYLNDEWNETWNGDTQLWNSDMTECVIKSYPKPNTAIIFVTTEQSWHGVPQIIDCPPDVYRKTIAFYYVSDIQNKSNLDKKGAESDGYRKKAVFTKLPTDKYDENMEELYKIRPYRLITQADLDKFFPDWTVNRGNQCSPLPPPFNL